jgi:hypothetical protein
LRIFFLKALEAAELAAARDADHDPAGMHKAADTERQMMQELYGGLVIYLDPKPLLKP